MAIKATFILRILWYFLDEVSISCSLHVFSVKYVKTQVKLKCLNSKSV